MLFDHKTIAVLLDGSPLSEKALPYGLRLARLCDARLLLVSALSHAHRLAFFNASAQADPPRLESVGNYAEQMQQNQILVGKKNSLAMSYPQLFTLYRQDPATAGLKFYLEQLRGLLVQTAARIRLGAEQVETVVKPGRESQVIEELAVEEHLTLVTVAVPTRLTSKNPGQLNRVYRLLSHTTVPLLLVPAGPSDEIALEQTLAQPTTLSYAGNRHRLVVVLDGTAEAETILPIALEVAAELNATVYLLRVVVSATAQTGPETAATQEQAYDYLNKLEERLKPTLLPNTWLVKAVRVSGDLASGISQFLEVVKPGMVAAALQPRHGLVQWPAKNSLKQLLVMVSTTEVPRPGLLVINAELSNHTGALLHRQPAFVAPTPTGEPEPIPVANRFSLKPVPGSEPANST